jgi:hypothetical protein
MKDVCLGRKGASKYEHPEDKEYKCFHLDNALLLKCSKQIENLLPKKQ